MVNGHLSNGIENGSVNGDGERNGDSDSSSKSPQAQSTSRRDLVLITGRKENCEEAKKAILVRINGLHSDNFIFVACAVKSKVGVRCCGVDIIQCPISWQVGFAMHSGIRFVSEPLTCMEKSRF
jgi:hypothetical protein